MTLAVLRDRHRSREAVNTLLVALCGLIVASAALTLSIVFLVLELQR